MPAYGTNNKWLDRSHPQTLYLATVLLYVNAAFWLLQVLEGGIAIAPLAIAAIFAGLGLANEKKAGFWLAVVVAGLNLLSLLYVFLALSGGVIVISLVINLIFAVALMALLLHPMTTNYRRIWFRTLNGR